jgi:hypothetical protein
MYPDVTLFGENGPELNDILNSDYIKEVSVLTSAAAILQHDPSIIWDLFETKEVNNERVYEIKLHMNGVENKITVDDFVLIHTEDQVPIGAQVAQNTMWMALLEKAFIKAVGNVETLLELHPDEPLYWMTGRPIYSKSTQFMEADEVWLAV